MAEKLPMIDPHYIGSGLSHLLEQALIDERANKRMAGLKVHPPKQAVFGKPRPWINVGHFGSKPRERSRTLLARAAVNTDVGYSQIVTADPDTLCRGNGSDSSEGERHHGSVAEGMPRTRRYGV